MALDINVYCINYFISVEILDDDNNHSKFVGKSGPCFRMNCHAGHGRKEHMVC